MSDHLSKWVSDQLNTRGWSIRELARRGDLTHSYVSAVIGGRSKPGAKFYVGMAKAFDLPVAVIEALDKEGIVPIEETDEALTFVEWVTILQELTPGQRVEVLQFVFRLLRGSDDAAPSAARSEAGPAPQPTR